VRRRRIYGLYRLVGASNVDTDGINNDHAD